MKKMQHSARVALGIIFASMAAAGCCNAADKTISNTAIGFEIILPEAWVWNEKPADGSVPRGESRVAEGATSFAVLNISVHVLKEGTMLKDFADKAIAEQQKLKNYVAEKKSN